MAPVIANKRPNRMIDANDGRLEIIMIGEPSCCALRTCRNCLRGDHRGKQFLEHLCAAGVYYQESIFMTSDRGVFFLAGIGVGIAGAVLFAPYKGKETRRRLQRGANDTVDQMTDVLRQGEVNIGDLKNRAKNKLDDVAGKTMKTADQAIDKSRDAAHSAGKNIEDV